MYDTVMMKVKTQTYLLFRVQPGDESFRVDKLKPKVPNLTQSDGPGHLGHTERGMDKFYCFIIFHSSRLPSSAQEESTFGFRFNVLFTAFV